VTPIPCFSLSLSECTKEILAESDAVPAEHRDKFLGRVVAVLQGKAPLMLPSQPKAAPTPPLTQATGVAGPSGAGTSTTPDPSDAPSRKRPRTDGED
jgi:hypothetical protein